MGKIRKGNGGAKALVGKPAKRWHTDFAYPKVIGWGWHYLSRPSSMVASSRGLSSGCSNAVELNHGDQLNHSSGAR